MYRFMISNSKKNLLKNSMTLLLMSKNKEMLSKIEQLQGLILLKIVLDRLAMIKNMYKKHLII